MNAKTRVSTLEARMAELNGESLPLLLPILNDESVTDALMRNGLDEHTTRPIVWLSEDDVNL